MLKAKFITTRLIDIEEEFNSFFKKNPNCYIFKFEPLMGEGSTLGFLILYKEPSPQHESRLNPDEAPHCLKCNKKMKECVNPSTGEPFWGCSGFPECRSSRPFSDADKLKFWGPGGDPGTANNEDIPF